MAFGLQGAGFQNELVPFFQAGNRVIINKTGLFVYNGPPALGNLVGSITAGGGVDPYGNAYQPTISSYFNTQIASMISAQLQFRDTGFSVNPASIGIGTVSALSSTLDLNSGNTVLGVVTGALVLADANGGVVANVPLLKFGGSIEAIFGSAGGQLLVVQNTSTPPGNSNHQIINAGVGDNALGIDVAGDTFNRLRVNSDGKILWGSGAATQDTNLYRASANQLQTDDEINWTSPGGTVFNAEGSSAANFNTNTVTGTSNGNLTQTTIPASDAAVGSIYKLRAYGQGQWGSTQQQLSFEQTLGGTVISQAVVAAGAFSVSVVFDWEAEVILCCKTTGAGGTWTGNMTIKLTQQTNASTGLTAAANEVVVVGNNGPTAVAVSSITPNIHQLGGSWASTTGAPTISKYTGWFEKKF
jgi:hypothetical protein